LAPVPPRLPDRPAAWGYVLGNLILPGVGTWAAKRRIAGALQLVLSQTGFVLMMSWGVWCVAVWTRTRELPTELGPLIWLVLAGAGMFFGAWLWALASSWQILRDVRGTGL
jgi:hypothetical protein